MNNEIPNRIFKYRSFDKDGHFKGFLKRNELYFSSPVKFNDPFDCRIVPTFEKCNKDEFYKKVFEHNKERHPKLSNAELKKMTDKNFAENYAIIRDPKLFSKRVNEMMDSLIGVFTLTEDNTNILMWSHYADSHKGFCVEYDSQRLLQICYNYAKIGDFIVAIKVKYSSIYPQINPYKLNHDDEDYLDYMDCLTVKSEVWSYEKEWRLIYSRHPNEALSFPDNIVKAIYFGVNCSDENINTVKNLTKEKKIIPKFYKAELRKREFGIEFIPI
jgi:hypothetical protein